MSAPATIPVRPRSFRERYLALVRGETRGLSAALLRAGLRMASWPYGLGTRLRNLAYDRGWKRTHRASVPVVSVGNLTVGGTGKTPCVEYVAGFYRRQERMVAILSRGYGDTGGGNDEFLVLSENLPDVPHLQGADRVTLAQTAVEELESEILVLDDAFQHRRLHRDLDIVLLDATSPHGLLLPAGLLRESPVGLRRAHVIMLTRCDQVAPETVAGLRQWVARYAHGVPIAETTHQPESLLQASGALRPLDLLAQRPVMAFCGIGNPEAFRRTLVDLGANLMAFHVYPDHYGYTRTDVSHLQILARNLPHDTILLTTQKDLVKLRIDELADRPVFALRIQLRFRAGQAELDNRLALLVGDDSDSHGG